MLGLPISKQYSVSTTQGSNPVKIGPVISKEMLNINRWLTDDRCQTTGQSKQLSHSMIRSGHLKIKYLLNPSFAYCTMFAVSMKLKLKDLIGQHGCAIWFLSCCLYTAVLTLVLLNKLSHTLLKFSANQIIWSRLLNKLTFLMANSVDPDQLASQKPTDRDLHCLQRQGLPGLSRTRVMVLTVPNL